MEWCRCDIRTRKTNSPLFPLRIKKNITPSKFVFSIWVCAVYIAEQNVKVSSSYVYHGLYFTPKLKKKKKYMINCRNVFFLKEPVVNSPEFWCHICTTIAHSWEPLDNLWPLLEEMLNLVTHSFLLLLCLHTCACGVKQASELDYGMQHLMFIWNSMPITHVSSHISQRYESQQFHIGTFFNILQYSLSTVRK